MLPLCKWPGRGIVTYKDPLKQICCPFFLRQHFHLGWVSSYDSFSFLALSLLAWEHLKDCLGLIVSDLYFIVSTNYVYDFIAANDDFVGPKVAEEIIVWYVKNHLVMYFPVYSSCYPPCALLAQGWVGKLGTNIPHSI